MAAKNQVKGKGSVSGARRSTRSRAATQREVSNDVAVSPHLMERGDVFFFYRPDIDEEAPRGLLDVRRFHIVLRPESGKTVRLMTIGRKKLPDASEGSQNHWGFVDRVIDDAEELRQILGGSNFESETLGERRLPEARPVGEGVYALNRVGRRTVLSYALELPSEPGEVQAAFNIRPDGHYELAIKNPDAGSPAGIGLDGDCRAKFSDALKERFGDRRWLPADSDFLDCEGAEFVLIQSRDEAIASLGIDLEPEREDEDTAEVFNDLKIERTDKAIRPLFNGSWQ